MEPKGETQPLSLRFLIDGKLDNVFVCLGESGLEVFEGYKEMALLHRLGFKGGRQLEVESEKQILQVAYLRLDTSRETQQKRLMSLHMSKKEVSDDEFIVKEYYPACSKPKVLPDMSLYNGRLSTEFLSALVLLVSEAKNKGEFTKAAIDARAQRRSDRLRIANGNEKAFGDGASLRLVL